MLTLSMIVKNEEKYLNDCLESVQGVVDEIVIVDTGSTDKTIEIANKFGAKVFHFDWVNDFSAARNFALNNSTGDWILYLDADERLTPESKSEVLRLTKIRKREAYYCIIDNIDEIGHRASLMAYPRLFPNKREIRFIGAVHEQIEPALVKNNYLVHKAKIKITHLGYNIEKDEMQLKAKRNLEILLSEFQKTGYSYYAYQIGQTYGILDNPEDAVFYFKESIKDPSLHHDFISTAYRYIAVYESRKMNHNLAIELINKSLAADDEQPLALLAASSIHSSAKEFTKADQYCRKALEINRKLVDEKKYSSQIPIADDETILSQGLNIAVQARDKNMFNYYSKLIQRSDSVKSLNALLKLFSALLNNNDLKDEDLSKYYDLIDEVNLNVVLSICRDYQKYGSKIKLLKFISPKFAKNVSFLNYYGQVLSEGKNYIEAEEVFESSYSQNPNEAPTIFFLVSVYLQNNKPEKIDIIIKEAEERFKNVPVIFEKINLLKNKLSGVVV